MRKLIFIFFNILHCFFKFRQIICVICFTPIFNKGNKATTTLYTGWYSQRTSLCLYHTTYIMLDVNVKMLFTLFCKSFIYYTKFENYLLSFLTFAVYC